MAAFSLLVRFRKAEHDVHLTLDNPSTEQIASAIAAVTGADPDTMKLLMPGKKGQMLRLVKDPAQTAQDAGLRSGTRVEMYASLKKEVEEVRNSKDLPGLASFEQELKQTMRRQRGSRRGVLTLPSGPYTFQKFEAWQHPGLSPGASEALKLLHRLAADPGVVGIMTKHRWTVGLLSEMPPEGKVGVSAMCILGVNINAGQEISLRLRTDDLKGFRRYDRIRETLCHELAHMVWGEHDNRFKELNSQLLKECSHLDWTGHAGHAVSGSHDPAFENPAAPMWVDEDDVMAVTAQSSGRTLRELGAGSHTPAGGVLANPRRAAAMAASARLASASTSPSSSRSASPELSKNASPSKAGTAAREAPCSSGAAAGAEVAINPNADIASMGHHDPSTEQAEEAMRALGSMHFASEAANLDSTDQVDVQKPHQQSEDSLQSQVDAKGQQQQQQQEQQGNGLQAAGDAAATHQQQPEPSIIQMPSPASSASPIAVSHDGSASIHATHAQPQHAEHAIFGKEAAQAFTAQDSDMADADSPGLQRAAATQEAELQQDDTSVEADSDDPAVQRYKQAEAAVALLKSQAGAVGQQAALQTLARILQNIVSHPGEAKYSHIRLGNAAFHSRAGQYPAARAVLKVAGFSEVAEGAVDKALVWKRNDQGLLWLTLSAVNSGLQ